MRLRAAAVVLALVYALLLWGAFAPGAMTVDSFQHWIQGRTLQVSNWHPPITALLMRGVMAIGGRTPAWLLLAQAFALALGCALLVRQLREEHPNPRAPQWASLAAAGVVLLLPPVLLYGQVMWKDAWMGIAFLFTAAGFLRLASGQTTAGAWGMFAAGSVMTALLRHNGLVLLAPLCAALALRPGRARRFGAATLALSLLAPVALERSLGAQDLHPIHQVLVHDLAGSESCAGFPDYPAHGVADIAPAEALSRGYTPNEVVPLFSDPTKSRAVVRHADAMVAMPRLFSAWADTVTSHPGCYLRHRWNVFARLSGIGGSVCYPFEANVGANGEGIKPRVRLKRLRSWIVGAAEQVKDTILFRLWFYLGLAALLAWAAWRARRPSAWLYVAVALYQLAYLPLGTTCDFRLGWVLVPVTLCGLADRLLHGRAAGPAAPR